VKLGLIRIRTAYPSIYPFCISHSKLTYGQSDSDIVLLSKKFKDNDRFGVSIIIERSKT
jgi:hypothetical protein